MNEQSSASAKLLNARIRKDPQKYINQMKQLHEKLATCETECQNLNYCLALNPQNHAKCEEYIRLAIVCFKNRGVIID